MFEEIYKDNMDACKDHVVYAVNKSNLKKPGLDPNKVQFIKRMVMFHYTLKELEWAKCVAIINKRLGFIGKKKNQENDDA